jgi:aminoglycoside phosphotransferase (APT) family kinase protein
VSPSELTNALETFLAARSGERWTVEELVPLAGGASAEVYRFIASASADADVDAAAAAPTNYVLRMDAPNGTVLGAERSLEFDVLKAAAAAGLRVPGVYWQGGEADGLPAAFFIMELMEGEALARRLLRDDSYAPTRAALPGQLAAQLARLHSISADHPTVAACEFAPPPGDDPRRWARAQVAHYVESLDTIVGDQPYPLLRLAARWLHANAPAVPEPRLVHGDFRVGNFLFNETGLTSILDWELSHLGDPVEDLGWLCVRAWRFGADDVPVGGLCDRARLLQLYKAAGGATVSPDHLRYWELFGNWKWAIICINQAARHREGDYPDVELATIGRRVAETEWELLSLLEEADNDAATLAEPTTPTVPTTPKGKV